MTPGQTEGEVRAEVPVRSVDGAAPESGVTVGSRVPAGTFSRASEGTTERLV